MSRHFFSTAGPSSNLISPSEIRNYRIRSYVSRFAMGNGNVLVGDIWNVGKGSINHCHTQSNNFEAASAFMSSMCIFFVSCVCERVSVFLIDRVIFFVNFVWVCELCRCFSSCCEECDARLNTNEEVKILDAFQFFV